MRVELRAIGKKIGKLSILEDIDLDFAPGAVHVILGPNGAGKTTLLRLVGLLDGPTGGEIRYDGVLSGSLKSQDLTALRRRIGFVFQSPRLLTATVFQNLVYGLRLRKKKIDPGQCREMLDRVGLAHKVDTAADKLSGGEKQRLQLGRVLLLQPELFLLDEPTANLDPVSTRKIEILIQEIAKTGKTVILSTHNLVQAGMLSQRTYFLNQGRLQAQGNFHDLFVNPTSVQIAAFTGQENPLG